MTSPAEHHHPAAPAPIERRTVGTTRLTWIPDGSAHFAPMQFFPMSDADAWQHECRDALDQDQHVCASIGALLVETGQHTVLVDTGMGQQHIQLPFGRSGGGSFLDNLAVLNVKPTDIDAVVYTHFHIDHTGWTTLPAEEGYALRFSRARHAAHRAEWTYWEGKDAKGLPYESIEQPLSSRIDLLDDGDSVVPGVTITHAPGHTPGHALVVIASGDERAIVTGDSVHSPVQIGRPRWGCVSDVDPDLAASTRQTLTDELFKPRTVGVGSHFPNSVFGRAMLVERSVRWVGWGAGSVA
jgi:glyoxylase-like metal-dependent hydrolase (beta-lactamase superfamily II)